MNIQDALAAKAEGNLIDVSSLADGVKDAADIGEDTTRNTDTRAADAPRVSLG